MITILNATPNPISFIGQCAGICYGKPTDGHGGESDYRRGLNCISSNHGRALEVADVTVRIDGYSARCIRELYTHIIGVTRLQESTRYINEGDFKYFTPKSVENSLEGLLLYENLMKHVKYTYNELLDLGIPKEDIANILPLGYESSIILKINVRALFHLSNERLCSRAYHEIRQLVNELRQALKNYDHNEWFKIGEMMKPKCEVMGYCPEAKSCGRKPPKEM